MKKLLSVIMTLALGIMLPVWSSAEEHNPSGESKKINPQEIIFEHLMDAYGWEVPFCHSRRIPLPVIVRDNAGEWHVFSSARLFDEHGHRVPYNGFYIAHEGSYANKLVGTDADGAEYRPLDLSVTKNVAGIIIAMLLTMLLVLKVRCWYGKHGLKAPRKFTACLEFLVEFIYDGVIRPTLGDKARKFAPYLLTVFFFIFVMNLLGLIVIFPGGANLTGNIAVTMVLAVCTFLVTNVFGTKHYWKDLFWPEVPLWLKVPIPLMPIIEIFGAFTKPVALMVRLYANMLGGHMVVIVLTLLIFVFGAYGVAVASGTAVVSVAFSIFMLLLDTLVSFIQAFVFTMLSTLFISLAQIGGHEHEHAEVAKS